MKLNTRGFIAIPLVLAVQSALAGNLINDGGFEGGVLPWTSTKSILTLDPTAAYAGQAGMKVDSAYAWCPYGALYTLDTSQLQNGTMYEFGARIRLANNADTSANHWLGLIKNGADPVWLDGEQSAYDGAAYPDEWTHLYGVYKANFAPTDSLKVCISGGANKPFHVDDTFVKPLTSAQVGYQPPATLDSANLVHADGNRLVVGSGNTPFVMKGINVYQYDPGYGNQHALDNFKYKNADAESYQEIRSLGFNTVRLNLSYSLFEDDAAPGVYKEEGWAVVDRNIQWAQQNGIRLILDMHVPPGGYQSNDYAGFGNRPDLQKRLEDLWVAIAQRYRNETTIVAYDLINEPNINNWFAYAQTVIDKIRAVDANHLIDVEVSFHSKDIGMYKLADDNILYDVHWYEPWSWAGSHTNNTPYTGTLEEFKQQLREGEGLSNFYDEATDSFTVPFNIGEYGITFEKYELAGVNGVTWLQHANAAFDYFGISRDLFHYNESNFGVYRSWNSYPNGHLTTTTALKAALPEVNGADSGGNGGDTPDTTPDAFSFTDQSGVGLSATITSSPITINDIDAATAISVSGGEYAVNGGVYTSTAGTVSNGDTVQVRHTSSAAYATATNTVLTVGGVSDTFTSTTAAEPNDATPDPFSFTDQTNVGISTLVESGSVTVSGINSATSVSVTSGEYRINGGAYTSAAGTVSNGDTVQVRHTSSALPETTVSTTLTIGGVSDTFSSTTAQVATGANADVSMRTFTVGNTAPTIGGNAVEFHFVLENKGADTATNTRFVMPLPAAMTWASGASECTPSATEITCNFGDLVNGASRNRYFYLHPTEAGQFTLTGSVVSDTADNNMANNGVSVDMAVTSQADMALTTFRTTTSTPKVGKSVSFNFVIKNKGDDVATNARFVLPMPANMSWISGASECTPSATEITCSFGDLANGASRNRYIYLRPSVAGPYTLTGSALSDTDDGLMSNNSKAIDLTVN
ncbi:cellulase family glycosylhydrolase [Thiothrix nivea]|uniref:Conserved repeat domain protein n=1 Tax=Thiothrix nivea (strain ATCC 35100 / DSM 5205 / JP2) TaxID=870187 RepID=A0A656HEE8_THINJ|nr:cellulase family glycosylhydrolase [Thiothrix nivea]EIJ34364.1 conserved repeat domain protein [Thiothrix nivea DSM 5205]